MKSPLFLSLIVSAFAFGAFADETKIVNTVEKKKVELSGAASDALKKWNDKFVLYSIDEYASPVIDMFKDDADQLPMATFGDFDGDGEKDIALLGHDQKTEYAIILLKQKSSYKVLVMDRLDYKSPENSAVPGPKGREIGLGTYLSLVSNSELKFNKKPPKKLEAVQVEVYGGPAHQYYVKNGKAVEYKGDD